MNDSTLDIKAFLDKDEQNDLLRLLTAGSVDDGKSPLDVYKRQGWNKVFSTVN